MFRCSFSTLPLFPKFSRAQAVPKDRLGKLLWLEVELVAMAQAETAIPAQQGVVVSRGTELFGLFTDVLQGPTNPLSQATVSPEPAPVA